MFKVSKGNLRLGFLAVTYLLTALVVTSDRVSVNAEVVPADGAHKSFLRISYKDALPATRHVKIGLDKSMIVELPRPVRDVLVSSPGKLDAVVHTANRVYLIGMKAGEANAFFFDKNGEQILTLEVVIERDLSGLENMLHRLIEGGDIKLESVNENVVLTGSVRNPSDAARASDIASRFAGDEKNVVNMLAVEAKEQVMLKVQVVEMNRNTLKQFGVNVGGQLSAGSLATMPLSANGLSADEHFARYPKQHCVWGDAIQ